jgi:MoaA/NifB/PqqE/SkfB family radical SAM enzyme
VIGLPLATLYLTERCNSRCVTCDYWRHGRAAMSLSAVRRLLPSLHRQGTQVVLLSGGEPLLNPEWQQIATLLRAEGFYPWLLTSGLSLAKHAQAASASFSAITVSLDGADRQTYEQIRGLDALDKVTQGIRAAVACGAPLTVRTTLQRCNYGQMRELVGLALDLRVRQLSFLAVDVANPHAFGRSGISSAAVALSDEDLPRFEHELALLEREHAAQFESGFIAESPAKLKRILQYFSALRGRATFPAVRCNAPEFSAVITATGAVQPCYFINAPVGTTLGANDGRRDPVSTDSLADVLNSEAMGALRAAIRAGERAECKTCVCSMWRDLSTLPNSLRLSA